MHDLDWNHLRVVLAIVRTGSLTAAARVLNLDQTTAGRRLSTLEQSLGVSLFRRAKSGFVATEAGRAVVAEAEAVEARLVALSDRLTPDRTGTEGIVRILGNGWMLSRLAEISLPGLLDRHPMLEVRFSHRLPPTAFYGEPTVGLWFDAVAQMPDRATPVARVPFAAYRSRDLDPYCPDWVIFRDDDAKGPSFAREAQRRLGKTARIRMSATDATILLGAVRAGIGQGILPVCVGDGCGDLVRSEASVGRIERVLYLHTSPEFAGRARMLTVLEWLNASLGPAAGALPLH